MRRAGARVGPGGEPAQLERGQAGGVGLALGPPAAVGGADEDVLEDGHRLEGVGDLVGEGDAGPAARVGGQRGDVAAVEDHGAAIGRRRPAMTLSAVVLPAPFGPMTPTASRSSTASVRRSSTWSEPNARETSWSARSGPSRRLSRLRRSGRSLPPAGMLGALRLLTIVMSKRPSLAGGPTGRRPAASS